MINLENSRPGFAARAYIAAEYLLIGFMLVYNVHSIWSIGKIIIARQDLEIKTLLTKAESEKYRDVRYEVQQMEVSQVLSEECLDYLYAKYYYLGQFGNSPPFPYYSYFERYRDYQTLKVMGKDTEARIMLDHVREKYSRRKR